MPLSRFFRFFAGLTFAVMLGCALLKAAESKTSGSISGTVKDSTGGVIPGATITATDEAGIPHAVESGADGHYVLRNLSPGTYKVTAQYTGLQPTAALLVQVKSGHAAAGDIVMTVKEQKQEVTVSETGSNQVSTEAANNVSALVLRQADLDALPDDPDDLQADLEALAGPSAGPRGPQIFIDGFTGGRMPPKSSIREIRINSNPFSAEYDKLGFGRIEIFTKPGTDKFHGTGYFGTSDGVWNSRNPFLTSEPPFMTQLFGGNVSGPLSRKASFFIDFDRRNIDDNGIVNATIPTDTLLSTQLYQGFYSTPQRRTTISPRVDYQLASNNALSMRYAYLSNDRLLTGIGNFDLPETTIGSLTLASAGYTQSMNEHLLQLVDTAVLGPNLLNETHFQYARDEIDYRSQSTTPQLNVANSFVAGGSGYSAPGYPASYGVQSQYELQNYTSVTAGAHTVKFGIRIRADELRDYAPNNFNGTYAFLGGSGLSSIDQYLTTLQLLNAGYTSRQVTAMGFGPSQYSVSTGNPLVSFSQLDFGPFVQDDWRVKPNLTLSFGLRWEAQTNISDKNDWAPRFSFAWSPDAKSSRGRAKTVIRGGWGMFYDRFQAEDVLNAYRYNGANQINYIIKNPTDYNSAFSLVPSLAGIPASNVEQRYQIDSNLQAPRLMQAVIGVERQLFGHTTMSVNLVNSRGVHELRTVDINAPLPGTNNTVRPYGNIGDIYDYQSTGIFKQTQLAVSLNSMIGRRVTLFSRYSYSTAHSNTDGLTTMPANPYDFSQEWGPSSLDIRQMLFLGGSISGLWGLRLSPFFIAHSGMPFNITTGTDLYGVGQIASTARPAVVSGPGPNIIDTPFGYLDVLPQPGQVLIERNAGIAPGFIELNLRLSKTWGFGTTKFEGPSGGTRARQGGGSPDGGGPGGGHGGGMRGGGFGGPGGGGPPPGGGPGGMFGGGTEHRYNLTLSISARNAIDHENLGMPVGVITSSYFLQSTGITGGFGPESVASNQRRIDIQLRFTF